MNYSAQAREYVNHESNINNIPLRVLKQRLQRGWTIAKALREPVKKGFKLPKSHPLKSGIFKIEQQKKGK